MSLALGFILKQYIILSAFVCSFKINNKFVAKLIDIFYLFVVFLLPTFILSMILCIISRNELVRFDYVFLCITFFILWCSSYYVISNRAREGTVARYVLRGLLCFVNYVINGFKLDKLKKHLIKLVCCFCGILISVFLFTTTLMYILMCNIYPDNSLALILSLYISAILFIYGKQSEIEERKACAEALITIIWLVLVIIQLHNYVFEGVNANIVEVILLCISIPFTVPTACDWLKNIPIRIIKEYKVNGEEVAEKITRYSVHKLQKIVKKHCTLILVALKIYKRNITNDWSKKRYKAVVRKVFRTLLCVLIFTLFLFISANMQKLSHLLEICFMGIYERLSLKIKEVFEKILCLLLFFIMMFLIAKGFVMNKVKERKIERIRNFIGVIYIESAIGYAAYTVIIKLISILA